MFDSITVLIVSDFSNLSGFFISYVTETGRSGFWKMPKVRIYISKFWKNLNANSNLLQNLFISKHLDFFCLLGCQRSRAVYGYKTGALVVKGKDLFCLLQNQRRPTSLDTVETRMKKPKL